MIKCCTALTNTRRRSWQVWMSTPFTVALFHFFTFVKPFRRPFFTLTILFFIGKRLHSSCRGSSGSDADKTACIGPEQSAERLPAEWQPWADETVVRGVVKNTGLDSISTDKAVDVPG